MPYTNSTKRTRRKPLGQCHACGVSEDLDDLNFCPTCKVNVCTPCITDSWPCACAPEKRTCVVCNVSFPTPNTIFERYHVRCLDCSGQAEGLSVADALKMYYPAGVLHPSNAHLWR
jgi:hypothetical protein